MKQRDFNPDASASLTGVRVLDLSRLICGNTLTQLLGDHGAEVVKVEPPQGDTLRSWRTEGIEAHWKNLSRNKKSLCLNFRDPESIRILRSLTPKVGVFVESFRPGTLETMGLGPEALLKINPNLILVRISGWGQDGPYARRPGFGSLVEGMSGLAWISGDPDGAPLLPPSPLADAIAGYAGAMATLMALRRVEVYGEAGQVVDVPLFDPLFSVVGPEAAQYKITGRVRMRNASRSANIAPRNVYRTKDDRWVALSASIQRMAMRLFASIDRPDLCDDPRYSTNAARVKNVDELDAIIGDFVASKTQDENIAYFEAAEVTIGPIYDISQIVDDPHFQQRETVVELPDEEIGYFPMTGIVPRLSANPGDFFRPAPWLGEHNVEVLDWIGRGCEATSLQEAGVLHQDARAATTEGS